MFGMKITNKVDIPRTVAAVDNDTFWTYAANEWAKLYEPWVPMAHGDLSQQLKVSPKEIEHTVVYANRQYNGEGFNFRKDLHPLASAEWDKAAIPTQQDKLIAALQDYVDSGRLNLNG